MAFRMELTKELIRASQGHRGDYSGKIALDWRLHIAKQGEGTIPLKEYSMMARAASGMKIYRRTVGMSISPE
jgi:hypothetical protein